MQLTFVQKSETGKERSFPLSKEYWITIFCDNDFNMFMAGTAAYITSDIHGLWTQTSSNYNIEGQSIDCSDINIRLLYY